MRRNTALRTRSRTRRIDHQGAPIQRTLGVKQRQLDSRRRDTLRKRILIHERDTILCPLPQGCFEVHEAWMQDDQRRIRVADCV